MIGMCAKGEECPFAHHREELKPLPDLTCTKLCKTLIKTGVCDSPTCNYAHCKDELRATSTFHKTKMCRFDKLGHCALGTKCNFAHSQEEVRPLETAPPPPGRTAVRRQLQVTLMHERQQLQEQHLHEQQFLIQQQLQQLQQLQHLQKLQQLQQLQHQLLLDAPQSELDPSTMLPHQPDHDPPVSAAWTSRQRGLAHSPPQKAQLLQQATLMHQRQSSREMEKVAGATNQLVAAGSDGTWEMPTISVAQEQKDDVWQVKNTFLTFSPKMKPIRLVRTAEGALSAMGGLDEEDQ